MSYKPEFLVSGEWSGNAQRFATYEEALESAKARFAVWTMPSDFRSVWSSDDVNYKRVDVSDAHV